MTDRHDGGPAYPLQSIGPDFAPGYAGMSLRDWFAGQALAGIMGPNYDWFTGGTEAGSRTHEAAHFAYSLADAMIAARSEEGK